MNKLQNKDKKNLKLESEDFKKEIQYEIKIKSSKIRNEINNFNFEDSKNEKKGGTLIKTIWEGKEGIAKLIIFFNVLINIVIFLHNITNLAWWYFVIGILILLIITLFLFLFLAVLIKKSTKNHEKEN